MDSPQATSTRQAQEDFKLGQTIVRHTLATDQLLEKYRMVSNTLGPGLGAEIPGLQPACLAARSRARRINQVICAAYQSLQKLRSEQMSNLPELTDHFSGASLIKLVQNEISAVLDHRKITWRLGSD